MISHGTFVISLDFELYWGIRDLRSLDDAGDNIRRVHEVFPLLLESFKKHDVKVTYATVGFLFAKSKEEILKYQPSSLPAYVDKNLSPYTDGFSMVQEDSESDPYHFGDKLIDLLKQYPEHEIGTHTFSHYYCLEDGANPDSFKADILAAKQIAGNQGVEIDSIVFPRNQYDHRYVEVCKELDIKTYRGNENIWYRKPRKSGEGLPVRIVRTLDCYVNISGNHCYNLADLVNDRPYNIPSSRFFRPYMSIGGTLLEKLKLRRIKRQMTYAAKNNKLFHLWWHPHNFSSDSKKNLNGLDIVLEHYTRLREKYGFESKTMGEIGYILDKMNHKTAI